MYVRYAVALLAFGGLASLAVADYVILQANIPDKPTHVGIVLPLTKRPITLKTGHIQMEHRWGKTHLYGDDKVIMVARGEHLLPIPSIEKEWEAKQKELMGDSTPEKRFEVAEWALNRGQLDKFIDMMAELVKTPSNRPDIQAAIQAYQQIHPRLQNPLPRDEAIVQFWMKQGCEPSDLRFHYTILFDGPSKDNSTLYRYAGHFEHIFQSYYYWFAFQGQVLPLPARRLPVLIVERPEDFERHRKVLFNRPLQSDGFFARRDNVVVVSLTRLDEPFEALVQYNNQELWKQGWNMQLLLAGKGDGFPAMMVPALVPDFLSRLHRAQMLALMQRALQDEGERATVTREAVGQLVAASGLLPRNVMAPAWIQHGMANVFETPKGALWTGVGHTSWVYRLGYNECVMQGLLSDPAQALERVVTDYYFQAGQSEPEAATTGQSLAWALTYFLAQRKIDGLLRYFQELSQLPRDLEFDDSVLLGCFLRAFDLYDAQQADGIDRQKLRQLAQEWHQYINSTPPPIPVERLSFIHQCMKGK
ncbi:MAG: DUF1570 domain-containing protein [Gemmataceae bacterium]